MEEVRAKRLFSWIITGAIIIAITAFALPQVSQNKSAESSPESYALKTDLPTGDYRSWILDGAKVLEVETEDTICLYNANWDHRYNSLVAVVTTKTLPEGATLENYAYDLGVDAGLNESDALVLLIVEDGLFYVAAGNEFSSIISNSAESNLSTILNNANKSGNYDTYITQFFKAMNEIYVESFGLGNDNLSDKGHEGSFGNAFAVVCGLIILVVLVAVISAIDRARFDAYRSEFYGVANPPYVFRPICFWHSPRRKWYHRHWNTPPPRRHAPRHAAPDRHPPHHNTPPTHLDRNNFGGMGAKPRSNTPRSGGTFGGQRSSSSGGFGGSRSGFGGSSSSSFSRGGGFSSSSRGSSSKGGSRSGGSRGGGFGGSRR